jgi:hypothetical protein
MPLESDFVRGVFQGSHTDEEFDTDHIYWSMKTIDGMEFVSKTEDTGEMIFFFFGSGTMEEEIQYIGDTKEDVLTGIGDGEDLEKEINYCPRCIMSWREKPSEICSNCNTVIRSRGVKPSA